MKVPQLNFTFHTFAPKRFTKGNWNKFRFQNNNVTWKKTKKPIKLINCKMRTNFAIQESKNIKSATNRVNKILDAKYEMVNLKEITTKFKRLYWDKQFWSNRLLPYIEIGASLQQ